MRPYAKVHKVKSQLQWVRFWLHTCGIVAVSLVSLAIVGPIAVVGVKQIDVFVVVTGQELWKDQTG